MNFKNFPYIYFLGIGGIGMSALARYFKKNKHFVAGYDKTPSKLTAELINEGIEINYEDTPNVIPKDYLNSNNCLIIFTPAIPSDNKQLKFFKENNFLLKKRASMLGILSKEKFCVAIAGTHGKTSITSLVAHLLYQTKDKCLSFFGGIAKNYNSNFLWADSKKIVVEADEFDRSFLHLSPSVLLITSLDADHLDIYGTKNEMIRNYQLLVNKLNSNGVLLLKKGLKLDFKGTCYTYSLRDSSDFYTKNLTISSNHYTFDLATPFGNITKLKFNLTGEIYLENAIASIATSLVCGIYENELRSALLSYNGVIRRFDIQILKENLVYIDDYAHHPTELKSTISSVRQLFPNKKICGIFQPHLYSRTKNFVNGFAESLDCLDEVILLPIYPAREKSIPGITTKIIYEKISKPKHICTKDMLLDLLSKINFDVLLSLGAGDIDRFVVPIKKHLLEN